MRQVNSVFVCDVVDTQLASELGNTDLAAGLVIQKNPVNIIYRIYA
ncbi:hypothetical protein GMES_1528 [Paraglaciecola mesophila KMM 241]|uniref:Uncharacterized protein n=1 Tax=Paraglaciecola mesophila KMM 241 TaxID=1128912 RepID=K6XTA4_9ALTE|nr:hypothetical protein GMES_1528 [Paraglaciecola mesophila KMM 241]